MSGYHVEKIVEDTVRTAQRGASSGESVVEEGRKQRENFLEMFSLAPTTSTFVLRALASQDQAYDSCRLHNAVELA